MESLEILVPVPLKQAINHSTRDDLPSTCSLLVDYFTECEPFYNMLEDLLSSQRSFYAKNKDASLQWKQNGNQCFKALEYSNSLNSYSQALRLAPVDAVDSDKNLVAVLYVNRALVLYKLNLVKECIRDCTRAIRISPSYSKAWYWRGKGNASLRNFKDAVLDLRLAELYESSINARKHIEKEIQTISDEIDCSFDSHEENIKNIDEGHHVGLQCINTDDKGRGMISTNDIDAGVLVHSEEPFAAILLKHCRDTYCYYCFNDLPGDCVPCYLCSLQSYCSEHCLFQASGHKSCPHELNYCTGGEENDHLRNYSAKVTSVNFTNSVDHIPDHKHECCAGNWPAVLPSDVVLAGRILVKLYMQRSSYTDFANIAGFMGLCDNYEQMVLERKLELHIYSVVLLYCLHDSHHVKLPVSGLLASQIVLLLSQVKVNSMTIVRMKSNDVPGMLNNVKKSSGPTCNVEQVRVAQAIYKDASMFNHSCLPNIHAYYLSRAVFLRTTEFVAANSALEMSYGPLVGFWNCEDRIKFLEDEYSFRCQCRGCSEINFSDLVINAFCCTNEDCSGVVLNASVASYEQKKIQHSTSSGKEGISDGKLGAYHYDNDIHGISEGSFLRCMNFIKLDDVCCLKCGASRHLRPSGAIIDGAKTCIKQLQDDMYKNEFIGPMLPEALLSLRNLRSVLHPFNKCISEAEDVIAQGCCYIGELLLAIDHCKSSIEVLEQLYGLDNITIGYELIKLASIYVLLGDSAAKCILLRVVTIFSAYYGSHAELVFPYLKFIMYELRKNSSSPAF